MERDIFSSSYISPNNTMDIIYQTPIGESDNLLSSTINIPERRDISSEAILKLIEKDIASRYNIPFINTISSSVRIPDYSAMDIVFGVPYGEGLKNLSSTFDIPNKTQRLSTATIQLIGNDIYSNYVIPYINYLRSILRITEYTEMDIGFTVLQPPITYELIPVIKDTYTRQSRPTLNHGTRQSLLSGITPDGEYITYLEFDLSNIQNKIDTGKLAKLINMNLYLTEQTNATFEIYECLSSWNEYSVTWNSAPQLGNKLYDVNVNGNFVVVDVFDYVDQLIQDGELKLNIAIKSESFVSIYSRESLYSPKLNFGYVDPEWSAYIGLYNTLCRAVIRCKDNRDFRSVVNILDKYLFTSNVVIKKLDNDIQSLLSIRSDWNSADKLSRTSIDLAKNDKYSTFIINSLHQKSDISSTFHQPSIPNWGTANIYQNKDIFSTFIVRSYQEHNDILSYAVALRYNIQSLVTILERSTIVSHAILKALGKNDIQSMTTIEKIKHNFPSSVVLQGIVHENYNSTISIKSPMFKGTVKFKLFDYFHSTSFIKATINKDVMSEASIRKTDFSDMNSSTIIEMMKHNFPSSALIRFLYNGYDDIHSLVAIEKLKKDFASLSSIRRSDDNDKYSSVELEPVKHNFQSTVLIVYTGHKDINSKSVFDLIKNSFPGHTIILQRVEDNIKGKVIIEQLKHNFNSSMTIRRHDTKNITSRINIELAKNNMQSTVMLVYSGYKDTMSSAIIDLIKYNMSSTVMLRRWDHIDISNEATIRRSDKVDLNNTAQLNKLNSILSTTNIIHVTTITGTAIIRQLDIGEVMSTVKLFSDSIPLYISSKVCIRQRKFSYLNSKVKINTTARRWIPNVHANDKFTYTDRKLPRKWIREDFIP